VILTTFNEHIMFEQLLCIDTIHVSGQRLARPNLVPLICRDISISRIFLV